MKKLLCMTLLFTFVFLVVMSNNALSGGPGDDPRCQGLIGAALGMCTAAIAVGCDDKTTAKPGCDKIEENFIQITGETPPWTTPYAIGDLGPAGGIVFYVTDGGVHGLEAAPEDQGSGAWGCYGTLTGAAGTYEGLLLELYLLCHGAK